MKVKIPYEPYPKQVEFHIDPHRYKLFGGAAGPGKTRALVMEAFQTALDFPGCKVLLLRRTFPQLISGPIDYYNKFIPKEIVAKWADKEHTAYLKNGSQVRFGSCRFEQDAWEYQGHEYLVILFDEICQFTYKIWTTLKTWNRCPIPGTFPWMGGGGNPLGVGLGWVKALFVDHEPWSGMEENEVKKYDPGEWGFVSATYKDNPIYANDPNYEDQLDSLPTAMRAALKEGRWDVLAGSYFDIFDPAIHVYQDQGVISKWAPRWASIDWGYDHPTDVQFHAQEGSNTYTYREFNCRRTGPRELARIIVDFVKSDEIALEQVFLDNPGGPAWGKRTDESTIAEQITEEFVAEGLPAPQPASGDRIGGWMLLYQLMKRNQWYIHRSCEKLIKTLPILVRDEDNREDILKVDFDDPGDCSRYGLYSRMRERKPPLEQRVLAKVTEKDPTLQGLQLQFLLEQEKKKENNGVVIGRRAGRFSRWARDERARLTR